MVGPVPGPSWKTLPLQPESVRAARTFAAGELVDVAATDEAHVEAVVLVVSEFLTNAVRYARPGEDRSAHLGIAVRERWTHVLVVDPDPTVPTPKPEPSETDESGRGLHIVEFTAEVWGFAAELRAKTAHAFILRTDEKLTPEERTKLREEIR